MSNAQECLNLLAKELLDNSFIDYSEDQDKTNAVITREIISQYKDNVLRRLLYENKNKRKDDRIDIDKHYGGW